MERVGQNNVTTFEFEGVDAPVGSAVRVGDEVVQVVARKPVGPVVGRPVVVVNTQAEQAVRVKNVVDRGHGEVAVGGDVAQEVVFEVVVPDSVDPVDVSRQNAVVVKVKVVLATVAGVAGTTTGTSKEESLCPVTVVHKD
jgi:hypothetical protein